MSIEEAELNIPDGYEIDYYNGLYYKKEDFDNFIKENKIILIPSNLVKALKEKISNYPKYRNAQVGDYYSITYNINQQIIKEYKKFANLDWSDNVKNRERIRFGVSIHKLKQ